LVNRSAVVGAAERTVPAWWRELRKAHGPRGLIRKDGVGTSFDEMELRSAAIARGLLAEGAGKGTRIGLLMANGPDWVASWLAVERIGGIAVVLSTFFSAKELAYALRHADVSILLMAETYLRHDYCARLEEAVPGLASRDGEKSLTLANCPRLRGVWVAGATRRWARGSLAELEAIGKASDAYSAAFLERVEDTVSSADLAILIYTSGSTADPKGVVHTQGTVVAKSTFLAQASTIMPFGTDAGSRPLINAPFFWVGGFLSLTAGMTLGSTIVCQDARTPPAILAIVRAERITHISGPEAGLRALRADPDYRPGDLDGLAPHNIMQRPFFNTDLGVASDRFPNSLGMTETFGPHSGEIDARLLPPEVAGSFGHALPGMEFKIVDPGTGDRMPPGEAGELCVRGEWLMDGFYKRDRREVFDADGFYHTGDRCAVDAEGFLHFRGRLGGMIKTSGANVSPEEVEIAIRGQDGVLDAAVFALPHAEMGEMVVAVVAVKPGIVLDEATLKARLKGELSSFKTPKHIVFMDFADLPRTPSNKIRKPALADLVAGRLFQAEAANAEV
jgi:acyl-CoA synthetase (AMP-forming)/AMP-acid ligase II